VWYVPSGVCICHGDCGEPLATGYLPFCCLFMLLFASQITLLSAVADTTPLPHKTIAIVSLLFACAVALYPLLLLAVTSWFDCCIYFPPLLLPLLLCVAHCDAAVAAAAFTGRCRDAFLAFVQLRFFYTWLIGL